MSARAFAPLSSAVVGDDKRLHDSAASIVCFGQCVRVGRDVGPDILDLGALTVDYFLVIVDKCVAVPMRGAPQLATGISRRPEAGEKPIDLRAPVPPDYDK